LVACRQAKTRHAAGEVSIDFTPPWPRISMVEEIEKHIGKSLPRNFEDESAREAPAEGLETEFLEKETLNTIFEVFSHNKIYIYIY
jgi:lysyl-tRNA synthetase class 2